MTSAAPPNYYAILEVSEMATSQQIRDAYKRSALKTHPDRVAAESPERPIRTRQFQLVNDAYYTLSDPARRREYDTQRKLFGYAPTDTSSAGDTSSSSSTPGAFPEDAQNQPGGGGFSWSWNYFTGQGDDQKARQNAEEAQFGDVFEEMLREEGMGPDTEAATAGRGALAQFWSMIGGVSGGALGFIMGNIPGMVAGAVAGNRLGAIRDARGKSVYAVFQELPQDARARLLSQLAAKVFSHAVGI